MACAWAFFWSPLRGLGGGRSMGDKLSRAWFMVGCVYDGASISGDAGAAAESGGVKVRKSLACLTE